MSATVPERFVPHAPSEAIDWVERLHAMVDGLVAPLVRAHGARLQCRAGCHDCCSDGLSVFEIEAAVITRHYEALLQSGVPNDRGGCAFLDEMGQCRIYAHRPYVCRTQGLPLRWVEEADGEDEQGSGPIEMRDVCPRSVPTMPALEELEASECWTLGPFEERLAAMQARVDGGARRRVALRALFTPESAPISTFGSPPTDDGSGEDGKPHSRRRLPIAK